MSICDHYTVNDNYKNHKIYGGNIELIDIFDRKVEKSIKES